MVATGVNNQAERAVIELFDLNEVERAQDYSARVLYLEEKLKLAHGLGLDGQVAMLEYDLKLAHLPAIDMEPLSDEENLIWNAFLPTSYRLAVIDDHVRPKLDKVRYSFDKIPLPVLEKLDQCVSLRIFDEYEIRTPEKATALDPILLGIRGPKRYMLARWAESDVNLTSLDVIKRNLFRAWIVNTSMLYAISGVFCGIMLTCIFAGSTHSVAVGLAAARMLGYGITLAVLISQALVWFSWKGNSLMQAIHKHKAQSAC